jgi:hypothetical protein
MAGHLAVRIARISADAINSVGPMRDKSGR